MRTQHPVSPATCGGPFHREPDGPGQPGGWWILFEPELRLGPDLVVPDVAGWRRQKMPVFGRPAKLLQRSAEHRPVSVQQLALGLPAKSWREVRWREGTKGTMTSRFAAMRVRAAHRDYNRTEPRDPAGLLIEWSATEKQPTTYWLSTVADKVSIKELVRLVKIRWRIERDYQEMTFVQERFSLRRRDERAGAH